MLVSKMSHNSHVTAESFLKIDTSPDHGVEDILAIVPETTEASSN